MIFRHIHLHYIFTCFCRCFLSNDRNILYEVVCSASAIQQSVCNVTLLKNKGKNVNIMADEKKNKTFTFL